MIAFRNLAGRPFRNGPEAKRQAIEKLARVTGLEPATSGVTGRAFPKRKQQAFRKPHRRNDAGLTQRAKLGFGTALAAE